MSRSVGLPLTLRPHEAVALELAGGRSWRVGELLALAAHIRDEIISMWPGQDRAGVCLLVSSRDPAVFLAGLFGCHMAGATATCWAESVFDEGRLAELVSGTGVITAKTGANGSLQDSFVIKRLGERGWMPHHPGNLVVVTSGSTGQPKGVSLSLESVALNAFLAGHGLGLESYDGWAVDIDFALMSAIGHFLMAWQFGLPLIHLGELEKGAKDQLFATRRIGFGGAPLQLKRHCEERDANSAPACMVSSGDFLTQPIVKQVQQRFPDCQIHSYYGLTEVSGRFCRLTHEQSRTSQGAAGSPLPGFAMKIDGAQPGQEGEGEIWLRSPLLFNGYYRTGQEFDAVDPAGWFATGDLGRQDENGMIWLTGRSVDVFKVSGEKVDRMSIERELAALLGPHDYCVLPVDHPLVGKVPALFIERKDGQSMPGWQEIISHLRDRLPSRFLPVYSYELDYIPRLANGKIDKQNLTRNHETFERLS